MPKRTPSDVNGDYDLLKSFGGYVHTNATSGHHNESFKARKAALKHMFQSGGAKRAAAREYNAKWGHLKWVSAIAEGY